MPDFVWIVIVAVGTPMLIATFWTILRRGGSIGFGKSKITIPSAEAIVIHGEAVEGEDPMAKALRYLPENIGQIHHMIYGRFLRMLKTKGCDMDQASTIEETVFARALIKIATSLGNGSNSVQIILQTHITRRDFAGKDLDSYVIGLVTPRIIDRLRETVNTEWENEIHFDDGTTRKRNVSQVDFVDMLMSRDFKEALVVAVVPFFRWAQNCLNGECGE